ncbi:ABC-three component system protein [Yersinia enterocolitica]|uniref:ABC-three component system protein n=1 Tax=Yersinia enterocolitica TaxID=630 RepID=UPI0003007484|nr:ABC-three component system protein [Yersinia enterocolitica]
MAISKAKGQSQSKRKTEVPGQALGYSLQFTRLTHLLLQAPEGSLCSMELLDDVAQENNSGDVTLIQSKSALTANPVADRAKSLWKTLSNWIDLASSPSFEVEKTIFELYVSRPVGGSIVKTFNEAKTRKDAQEAIAQARKELWGEPPHFNLKNGVAKEIATYIEKVFTADQNLLQQLICNFQLTLGSGSPQADLEACVRSHPVSPSKVSDIANYLCGKVKRHIDMLLEAEKPAVVARDEFHTWYRSYVQKIDRQMVLSSRAQAPEKEKTQEHLPDKFVQQLEIIGLPYEEILGAVSDYLMASFDRTDWATRGEVDETSFDDLDTVLQRTWKNKQRTCGLTHREKVEQDQGQLLYFECIQFSPPVQAMSPPSHFIPGCYHILADSLAVGWHPNYEVQLKNKKGS